MCVSVSEAYSSELMFGKFNANYVHHTAETDGRFVGIGM